MLLLDDEMKQIYRTDFRLTQTTDLACAQVVEKFMPFAVARPFVEEFISKQIIDRVINYIYVTLCFMFLVIAAYIATFIVHV